MEPDLNPVFAALEEDIASERGVRAWLCSRPTWQRVGLAALVAIAIPLLVLATWARVDLPVFPRSRLAIELAILIIAALPALWLALRPLHLPMLPQWTGVAVIATAVAAAALVASLPPAHALHPASMRGVGDELVARALACFIFGSIFALPMFLALFVLDRSPGLATTALVLAGLVGNISLELHCPIVSPAHLLAGHFTVPLAFALLAVVLLVRRRQSRSL
jgi:hypothetical protein